MTAAAEILDEDARREAMPAWRRRLSDLPSTIRLYLPVLTVRRRINDRLNREYARAYMLGDAAGFRRGGKKVAKAAMLAGFKDGAKSMLDQLDAEGLLLDSPGVVRYGLTERGMAAARTAGRAPASLRRLGCARPDGVA